MLDLRVMRASCPATARVSADAVHSNKTAEVTAKVVGINHWYGKVALNEGVFA